MKGTPRTPTTGESHRCHDEAERRPVNTTRNHARLHQRDIIAELRFVSGVKVGSLKGAYSAAAAVMSRGLPAYSSIARSSQASYSSWVTGHHRDRHEGVVEAAELGTLAEVRCPPCPRRPRNQSSARRPGGCRPASRRRPGSSRNGVTSAAVDLNDDRLSGWATTMAVSVARRYSSWL